MSKLLEVPRTEVKSSNVKSVGYDKESHTLVVEFHSSDIYSYCPITPTGHIGLMQSESVGKHLNAHIKNNDLVECEKLY